MATAFGGSQSHIQANKHFSEQAWRSMLAEDTQAFKAVAIVLATVITMGFLAIAGTVWLVL